MDINIKINNVNRCIPLPNVLRKKVILLIQIRKWKLYIHFQVEKKKGGKVLRILIYTGKGGVGKTSIAAATAFFSKFR